ncbi:hypothetical protein AVEN_170122-1 [Araneus ventricosus]|uniref:Uncharacterized protein n=1 Tax=Araneus ventricosus TaxID=182803 RepID=A0A4Y2VV38_ARAVE|nr:hypothetical protein AVEN_48713-1 [Araneus ventricosus]GBO28586.1 hypothetical protein AVEN_170122-1 [Araneus ventricosus]
MRDAIWIGQVSSARGGYRALLWSFIRWTMTIGADDEAGAVGLGSLGLNKHWIIYCAKHYHFSAFDYVMLYTRAWLGHERAVLALRWYEWLLYLMHSFCLRFSRIW